MRVFINGFGRIGRSVLRAFARDPERWPGLKIVGINDIATDEMPDPDAGCGAADGPSTPLT